MKKAGLGVAAISYDPPATLKRFSAAHQISYPLLSDQGSAVIRKFGILNPNIPEGNMFHGIPFPGDYVLAPDGTVTDKHFIPDYQTRPTASGILLADFNVIADGASVDIAADEVRARISLSSAVTAQSLELGVSVEITIASGWHVYGEPLPEGYVPTSVRFTSDFVSDQHLALPRARPVEFKMLGETLPVYEGSIRGKGSIAISRRAKPGDYKLAGVFKFQECSDTVCKVPQQIPFEIPIRIEPMTAGLKK